MAVKQSFNDDEYQARKQARETATRDSRRREADPARYAPLAESGMGVSGNPVSVYGSNMDNTPSSARKQNRLADVLYGQNRADLSRTITENAALKDRAAATATGTDGTNRTQSGNALLAAIQGLTTADRNPQYNQLPRVLAGGSGALKNYRAEGGNLGTTTSGATAAGGTRDYYLQTGQAANPEAARQIYEQERANMGRGSGVAVTESGKVIRVDDNYEYGIQKDIDNPTLRDLVPALAQANTNKVETAEQRALRTAALELAKSGIDLPEGTDINNMTPETLRKMQIESGKSQKEKDYQNAYLQLAKTFAGLKVSQDDGMGGVTERSLTPDEINTQIAGILGPSPAAQKAAAAAEPAKTADPVGDAIASVISGTSGGAKPIPVPERNFDPSGAVAAARQPGVPAATAVPPQANPPGAYMRTRAGNASTPGIKWSDIWEKIQGQKRNSGQEIWGTARG